MTSDNEVAKRLRLEAQLIGPRSMRMREVLRQAVEEIERLEAKIEEMKPHMALAGVELWEEELDAFDDPPFEIFWSAYPKRNGAKVGKANAKKQWTKLKRVDRRDALDALALYMQAKGAYPEDAERYLRHRRWVGLEVETPGDRDTRVLAKAEQLANDMGIR